MSYNKTFLDLGLEVNICNKLSELGFDKPFPIQIESIPKLINGLNIIGNARTGSGKTIAFVTPFLNKIDINLKYPQFLIIEPTRELVIQVSKVIYDISSGIKKINISSLYGGQNYNIQFKSLKDNPNFIIGTPGRLIDHIKKGTLNISKIKGLVIDEADEMLNMGFINDVKYILSNINNKYQIALFSATLSKEIKNIAYKFTDNLVEVVVNDSDCSNSKIEQNYIIIDYNLNKKLVLLTFIEISKFKLCIIFVNTKNLTIEISDLLKKFDYNSSYINGDINQKIREKTIKIFVEEKINILVATDIVARGIDINKVDLIINYDSPNNIDTYIHRIGRTGRAGKDGKSFIFINKNDFKILKIIKNKFNINRYFLPSLEELNKLKESKFIDKIKNSSINIKLIDFNKIITKLLDLFNNDYINLINVILNILNKEKPIILNEKIKDFKNNSIKNKKYYIFKINIGKNNKIDKKFIINILLKNFSITYNNIGYIVIYNYFSKIQLFNFINNIISYNNFLKKNIKLELIK
ncbi:DEAD/DEAH box helicase [endosymbiont of Pachyrhynchus infernalis]|uniref:DEAD/DEAH box helicase n=1 Tax=endosymbiont of Pachyrhynchus infernalis TaxID=1971488 RepID=UPI000DC6FA9F|nr:DEAD/DEAH box helicase [endosymbiont of Pachyrhynchus infernalis]BBA84959.1 ATP-dependent RNA helicase DeaD [endosymbiont of Pachyrhynchus infernalis]